MCEGVRRSTREIDRGSKYTRGGVCMRRERRDAAYVSVLCSAVIPGDKTKGKIIKGQKVKKCRLEFIFSVRLVPMKHVRCTFGVLVALGDRQAERDTLLSNGSNVPHI